MFDEGDTALHAAAFAYDLEIARELVARRPGRLGPPGSGDRPAPLEPTRQPLTGRRPTAGKGPDRPATSSVSTAGRLSEDARRRRVELGHLGSEVLEPGFSQQIRQLVGGRRRGGRG